jgi:transcription initiation factor TFIID subunit 7
LFESSPAFATPTGEVERDDVSKEVGGTATGTREASFEDDDDDDDLFGDGDDDAEGDEEAVIDTAGRGAPLDAEAMDVEGASIEEGGDEEIDAEMAAMLDAELGTIGGDASETLAMGEDLASELPQAQFIDAVDVDSEGLEHLIRQDAALDYDGSAASGGFGVEGGVGMRRLATGVMEDDEDADSDTSGSTD